MTRSYSPVTPLSVSFRWLALLTTGLVLAWQGLNGVLRASGYGAGCVGYWPLCNGGWFAPLSQVIWLDWLARGVAALAIPCLLVMAAAAWQRYRRVRWVVWPAWLALGVFLLQFLLGVLGRSAAVSLLHYADNLALAALLVTATAVAFQIERDPRLGEALFHFDAVSRLALAGAALVGVLLIAGEWVAVTGARAACLTWPACDLTLGQPLAWLDQGHRVLALLAGLVVAGGVIRAWRLRGENAPVLVSASLTAALFGGQVLIGAANVLNAFPLTLSSLHAATAVAAWASVVAFAVLALQYVRLAPLKFAVPAAPRPKLRAVLADYFLLTKPIIMALLLVTTAAAMVVAGRDWPPLDLFLWTMLGGALASGGASALNQVIDRDLDKHMTRTARRPLAQGRVTYAQGLAFGVVLTVAAFYVLAVFVNLAAATWAMIGTVYYVIAYSVLLKKTTVQNIVIGGGAGAIPPLVGWAAVTGGVSLPAWFLFALVFFWTPPHFWALSLLKKNDYARAGVPMLPVVLGEPETRRQIVLYTFVMVALSLLFAPARVAGLVYLISALGLGLIFLAYAVRLWRSPSNKLAWGLYRYSSMYLALMFAVLVLDQFVYIALYK